MRRILVIETAGLGWRLWERVQPVMPHLADLAQREQVRRLKPAFPAVTVTCQATFLTGLEPAGHGMVANGLFHRDLLRAMFWEQSAALVEGERLWEALKRRRPEARSAMLFWQNSIGSGNDLVLSPAASTLHNCTSKPTPISFSNAFSLRTIPPAKQLQHPYAFRRHQRIPGPSISGRRS